jgi:phosphoglycolate phosphatase
MGASVGFDVATGVFQPGSRIVASSTGEIAATLAELTPHLTAADIERLANERAANTQHTGLTPASTDLPKLLDRLAGMGLKLGVATHDAERSAKAHLAQAGVLEKFDFIAGYDSGHGLKPLARRWVWRPGKW